MIGKVCGADTLLHGAGTGRNKVFIPALTQVIRAIQNVILAVLGHCDR